MQTLTIRNFCGLHLHQLKIYNKIIRRNRFHNNKRKIIRKTLTNLHAPFHKIAKIE